MTIVLPDTLHGATYHVARGCGVEGADRVRS
jgi:hypothetical protein